jgi:EAL domain-containing protein (putative c-di-GMP-specific phosphodiesterase class I)
MPQAELQNGKIDCKGEGARLSALASTGILDSAPEPSFDAITRLAAEYFKADTVLLEFADESRVWIKSYWGEPVRELPRKRSVFEMVLAEDGPVVVPTFQSIHTCRRSADGSAARGRFVSPGVPVRSDDGMILGALAVFSCQPAAANGGRGTAHAGEPGRYCCQPAGAAQMRKTFRVEIAERHTRQAEPSDRHLAAQVGSAAGAGQAAVCAFLPAGSRAIHAQIVGLEALIRWQHPERGLVPPMDFIPLAEESGLILPIGDWGLSEACGQIQRWCREDPENGAPRVCVNLSARQFAREGLADHVEALLRQSGVPSRLLGLEMTESSLIPDNGTPQEVLGSLRRLGVSLLMDDFGTGYSSLHHLHSLPFDVLKIDRSFVSA